MQEYHHGSGFEIMCNFESFKFNFLEVLVSTTSCFNEAQNTPKSHDEAWLLCLQGFVDFVGPQMHLCFSCPRINIFSLSDTYSKFPKEKKRKKKRENKNYFSKNSQVKSSPCNDKSKLWESLCNSKLGSLFPMQKILCTQSTVLINIVGITLDVFQDSCQYAPVKCK